MKAIFLDRDGTINEDVGDLYQVEKLIFIPGAIEALKILQERFALFIVTNQAGIGRNVFSESDFLWFSQYFSSLLHQEGVVIRRTYFCPHLKEEKCVCYKPNPYFLKQAQRDYGVDLKDSFVIGDHPHDVELAYNAGCGSVYVLTGHGNKHKSELISSPDFIAKDLREAAEWILIQGKIRSLA